MQSRDWSIARRTQAGIDEWDTVETAWLKFRCALIWQDVDRLLDALAIPKAEPDVQYYGDWRAWACDFQFLRSGAHQVLRIVRRSDRSHVCVVGDHYV